MKYLDPLYGQIAIDSKKLKLFQTRALARLRDISLSAVPPLALPSGNIASRFEHSVGVSFLAEILSQRKDFKSQSKNLFLASLLHDAGSPPFSHVTEPFLEKITGKSHEAYIDSVLQENDLIKEIKNFGGNIKTIASFIKGEAKPFSDLINGTIDLDNIDNSLRWGMGAGIFQDKFYEPTELVGAFIIKNGKLGLRADYQSNIQKWELCRRLVYELVYSDENLAPGAMLLRALNFAYEEEDLAEDFFSLTESQAFYLLENRFNLKTRKIASDIRFWRFFKLAFEKLTKKPSKIVKKICKSADKQQELIDEIAKDLKIKRESIAIYAGKDKGFKKIHLPFFGREKIYEHSPIQPLFWRIKIYIHPKEKFSEKRLKESFSKFI
jgi:HD superfamily phosphohydrolase